MVRAVVGGVSIVAGRPGEPVDGLVVEEDTWLVLSAPSDVPEPAEHPLRVMTGAHEAEPVAPGSVLVREGPPVRLLAVVHDVGAEPSWREAWVADALRGVLREAAQRGLRSVAIPVLGAVHGSMPPDCFAQLLRDALLEATPTISEIRLMGPEGAREVVLQELRRSDPCGTGWPRPERGGTE